MAVLVLTTACATAADPEPEPASPEAPRAASGFPTGPPPREPAPVEPFQPASPGDYEQPVDVLHYELELAVSDTAPWIQGRARLDVSVLDGLEGPLDLDFTGLLVDRVTVEGRAVRTRHVDGRLLVPLPPDDHRVAVEVLYRGVPDDGLLVGENVHGQPSVFADNWPNRARFWFPSVDHPSDKATASFIVHAPAEWWVVANGELITLPDTTPVHTFGPGTSGDRLTWRWVQEVPISTYNMVVGGAEMVVRSLGTAACGKAPATAREDGCVQVTTWLFPPDTVRAAPSFRRAPQMVDHFTRLFGPFPYAKLAHVQSSTRFGGMENASAIFYSEAALAEGRNIEGTVSHEVAHQWFGNSVTEADWSHLWLSEGFATYFGAQFFEAADGPEAFRERMAAARLTYLGSEATGRPVIDPDPPDLLALLNANNYQKGAWILHMLRQMVGDEAFFGGTRTYLERFRNGVALTEDFRSAMEEASGRGLEWFFHQWLLEPGHPVLQVGHEWDEEAGEAVVTLRQVQDEAWPTFRLPLELELRTPAGPVREEVNLTEREQVFRLDAPAAPTRIVPDPEGKLLLELRSPGQGTS